MTIDKMCSNSDAADENEQSERHELEEGHDQRAPADERSAPANEDDELEQASTDRDTTEAEGEGMCDKMSTLLAEVDALRGDACEMRRRFPAANCYHALTRASRQHDEHDLCADAMGEKTNTLMSHFEALRDDTVNMRRCLPRRLRERLHNQ